MYRHLWPIVFSFGSVGLIAGCSHNVSLYAENDSLHYGPPTDANYTNGIQLSLAPQEQYDPCDRGGRLSGGAAPCEVESWTRKLINGLNVVENEAARTSSSEPHAIQLEYGFGQQMYTPDDISKSTIDPFDRPYAGWLFGFLKIHNDRALDVISHSDPDSVWDEDRRRTVTAKLGVVGPSSQASAVQKYWHEERCDCQYPNGWDLQIRDEPGFIYALAQEDRHFVNTLYEFGDGSRIRFDALTKGEVSIGNVYTGVDVGGTIRLGLNLPRQFTPSSISQTVSLFSMPPAERSTTPGVSPEFHLYGFAGVTGRIIGRDIFLDGNTFRDSPHTVDKEPLVSEGQLGIGFGYGRFSGRVLYVHRSKQFTTQEKDHRFGSIVLSWQFTE